MYPPNALCVSATSVFLDVFMYVCVCANACIYTAAKVDEKEEKKSIISFIDFEFATRFIVLVSIIEFHLLCYFFQFDTFHNGLRYATFLGDRNLFFLCEN